MLINLIKLEDILVKQQKLDMSQRGMQPSLTYGCFKSLEVKRTEEHCETCRNYEITCKIYLASCEIKEVLFKRE